jgi:hypothetical protein
MLSWEGSEKAELRNVQDVARIRSWEIGQEGGEVGDGNVRGNGHDNHDGLNSLGAASARHAGWRTGAVVASGQLIACARFVDNEARDTGRAERQQANNDCEGEPPHEGDCSIQAG